MFLTRPLSLLLDALLEVSGFLLIALVAPIRYLGPVMQVLDPLDLTLVCLFSVDKMGGF
jgi:hypothetical protein